MWPVIRLDPSWVVSVFVRGTPERYVSFLLGEGTVRKRHLWAINRPSSDLRALDIQPLLVPCHLPYDFFVTTAYVDKGSQGTVPNKGHSRCSWVPGGRSTAGEPGQVKGKRTRFHAPWRKAHTSHWKHSVDSVEGRGRAGTESAGNKTQLTSNKQPGWAGEQSRWCKGQESEILDTFDRKMLPTCMGSVLNKWNIDVICPQTERHTFGRVKDCTYEIFFALSK